MGRSDYKKGGLPYNFLAIPKDVIDSDEWRNLPHAARVLLIDIASQYTGKNNGRLTPSFEAMRKLGWSSKTTLISAKRKLLEASFVVQTRKGHAPRTAEWVALTWWKLNWVESMDIGAVGFPYLNFMSLETRRIDPNKGRGRPQPNSHSVVLDVDRSTSNQALRGTETGPMNALMSASSVQKLDHLS